MATKNVGYVVDLNGSAQIRTAEGVIKILNIGDTVSDRDLLITGDAANVVIAFYSGQRLQVSENAEVLLDETVYEAESFYTDEQVDQIAALQQAILEGKDLTELEATAAGNKQGQSDGLHETSTYERDGREGEVDTRLTGFNVDAQNIDDRFNGNDDAVPAFTVSTPEPVSTPQEPENTPAPVSTVAPVISVTANDVVEESVSAGDIIASFTSSDADGDSLSHQIMNDPGGYFTLNGTDVELTAAGVAAINDDLLDLSSIIIEVEVNDGTSSAVDSDVSAITRVSDVAPVAGADSFTTDEDTVLTVNLPNDVLANDNDLDGDSLSVNTTPITDVSNGTLSLNVDGTFTYTPDAHFNGTDSFIYEVSDGNGGTAQATVTITVNPVADLNTTDDAASGNEDTTISSTVAANDSTTSGGALTYVMDTGVSNGSLVFNSDGSYDYTPNSNFNGSDSFTYTVTDATSGESSTQTVTLTVNPVTDLSANDDAASGNEDTTISNSVAGNDSTISGGALTYAIDTGVANGSLVFSSDGSYDYTPNSNFNGTDSFTYIVTDATSGETATQTVTLTINPITDLTANDDTASGNEDTTISNSVASNDSTTSGGVLTYAIDTGVTNGSLVFSSDGSYDYTPNANFNGTDSFTYTVTDAASGESLTQTVSLTINPVTDLSAADDTASGNEDTTISNTVASNDSTTSGGALTYAIDTGVSNGSLVFSSDGSYEYTPNANFNGTDSFTYTVTDAVSGETAIQTVSLTVNPVADLSANDDSANGDEDTTISSSVAGNDSTLSGGALTYAIDTGVSNGSLVFSSDGSYDYTPNANFNGTDSFTYTVTDVTSGETSTQTVSLTVNSIVDLTAADDTASGSEGNVISSSVAANDSTTSGGALTYAVDTGVSNGSLVFSSDGSYDYTPNANFNGSDSFTYTVTDAASGESLTQTVTLTINPVTDLSAADDSASGNEDTTISSTVAANDSTTSGGTLSFALDTGVSNGSLVFSSDGSYDYTPNANFNGTDSFTYTVTDSGSGETATQTVSITVNPVIDLTANDDVANGNEDTTISNTVASNDSTTSGGALTYAVDTGVLNGSLMFSSNGSYDYTPNANFTGTDSFTYTVTDADSGESLTQTVTLTVNPVIDLTANDDVASGNEDTTISSSVAGNDSTTSGGTLSFALDTGVTNGSLVFSSDGSYDYTPNANFNGTDSFTYIVTDTASGETSTQTVSLTVNPVTDLSATDDTASGNEDTTISNTVASNDSTTSGGVLTYAIDTGVTNGSLVFSSDGSYDYTPNANFNGTDSFTYTVTDAASGESLTQTVSLTINPVTDLSAADDTASGNEDTTISNTVASNDSTTSGGALTYAIDTGVSNGSLVFSSDGSYDYTPNANFNGTDSFTYTVTDAASSETSIQTVTLTVNPVIDLTAADDTASGNEDTTISNSVAGNDSTTSGGILTYVLDTGVSNGSLVFTSDGSYDYTPNSNFTGTDSFTYIVTDAASGETATQTVTLTVNPVVDLTAADDTASGNEDTTISSSVSVNDSTTSGGSLTYAVDTGVSNGTLVFSSDGSYDYTPNANFNGTDSFTYIVTDATSGETSTQTVTLTVNPVTDLTAANDSASGNEETTISNTVAPNDSTTSGGALTYAVDTGVSNGSLVFSSDGSYDYTPNTNFNGTDSFTYTVTDATSGESATQSVTITVNPVVDLTAADDTASGNEETTISSSVAGNDSTTSGGALNYAVDTGVSNGSLVFSSDGSYDYTPNSNFNGTDSFTYTVTDAASGETATQTVTLTVNPVTDLTAANDSASGNEDTTISSSVAGNDSTTSGGALTYAVDTGVSNGILIFASDGSYDYTPNANFNGTDSFSYTVTDTASGETATQTVTLTVNPVIDLTAADDVASGSEGSTISSSVASNDSTTSGGTLTYAVDTGVSNGSLVFSSDGSYVYTPNSNYNGTDSFTYTVTDAASGESLTQTVSLTINPVTDLSAADDTASGNEDTTISSSVAGNDSTTSGGSLSYMLDTGVSNGSLVFNSDGSYDYTPNANFNGTDSFTYTVTDSASGEFLTQNVTITVNPVVDLSAADDTASGNEDTTISNTVASNDSTTSGGALTYAVDTGVTNGSLVFSSDGSYDYTPNANFNGTDSFTYTVTDSASGEFLTQNVTITVNPVVDLSAADDTASGNEDTTISNTVASNDSTTSGGALTYAVDTGVSNGSLVFSSDGSYDYTPNANFNGTDSFTYTVTDAASGESLTQTVSLTVNPVADLTAADDTASGNEDTIISSTVASNDSTTSGGALTYAVDTGVSNGSLVFSSDGSYDYTPNSNFNGTDSFTYTVTDPASGESLTQTVSLTVNPVTDLAANDDTVSGNEDTTISSSVAGNDSTTSGGVLTYAVDTGVSNGSLVFTSDGSYDYTPNSNLTGTDSFTYIVTDADSGETSTQTVTITVNSITDLSAADDTASGNEDTTISSSVAGNDSTTSGGVLTYAMDTGVSNGSLVFSSDGSYDYTPNANFNGTDSFTYTVTDAASGETATQTVTLTVNPVVDLTAADDTASGNEDTVISSTVASNDSTTSGGVLTYAVDTGVSNGSLVFSSDGSYDYTPNANFNGSDSFTYTVTDAVSGETSTQTVSLTVNPVTDLAANDDTASGNEDTTISNTVASNDSTTSGGALTYAVDTGVTNGSLVFSSDGSYDYTPNANFNGTDSFTYTVTDAASGESLTQTVSLTINPVTDLSAADDTASGNEDTTISSSVAGNDSTTSGGSLSYMLDTGVSNGSLVFNSDGSYNYTPNANFNGTDSFTYTVTDSASGESLTQNVTITVNPVTDLAANDDTASGNEDTTISSSVAGNDSTTSGGVLTYAVDTGVSNGSLVFTSDGSYDYTPNSNFTGTDSFTYIVTDADSGETSTQTVTITVNSITDLSASDDTASGNEDTTISSSVAGNDSTTSGGVLTYAVDTGVSNGSLVFSSDGSYDYTPNANFNGSDSFTYTVTDAASGETSTQTVSLTVNPVTDLAANDDTASGNEDTTISSSVAGNDSTTSGGALTYAVDTGVSNGSLVFSSDGSYDYTPNANFNGTDSFTYTVTDAASGETATQTVTLTVNPVTDLAANDDAASGNEDTTISSSVAGNDSTSSGGALTYAVDTGVSNGSLVFSSDGSYDYTPNANFNGTDSFTYTVTDAASGESLTQTVSLTVNPVTDLAANDDAASGNEDTTISNTVASNDSTTSGGALTYAVDTGVSNGSLVFSSDGSYDYTPNSNFNGTDSFTYIVTDAASGESLTQTVSLTVNPVTDLAANDDTASGNEDTTISSSVAGNDSTTSGGALTYAVDTGVSNGSLVFSSDGSYDYTPNANFNGTDSFTYTVTDAASGESLTQTVSLTVNPVIDLTAADDTASGNEDTTISSSVAGNDSTTSGGALTYAVDTGVSNGSLVFSSDGSYDYTPNANFNGSDSFTYTVTDAASGETSTQTVSLTVNPVADLTANDDSASGNEDTTISSSVAGNDSTTSGGALTYAVDTGVSNGSLVFSSDGSYDYTPNSNFNGTDSFTYTATDAASGESLTQNVTITVNPVTDLAANDDTASGNEDTTISSSVAGNDSTTSGGVLTYALDTGVSNGSLVFTSDGSYDYTPNSNFSGTDSFTYTVTDAASGESLTQTVSLTVNPVIDLTAADDTASGNEDTTISSSVAGNDSTTSGGALTYAVDTGVSNGSLVFSSDGSYDYTPNANFNGTDSFTYTVTDAASGETATQTVTLTVNPVTDLAANDDTASGNEDTTISSSVAGNDSTTSGGVLTYAIDTGVTNGSLVFSSDGSYDYTPNANFNGTDSFTYTVTDAASGETATQTVTLTVNPVTDLAANDDTASGNEDTVISSTVASNDSTTSGGALTYAVDTGVSNGSLVFSSDGSYDYTPNSNFNGTDSFTYTVTDAASGETATQTVTLTVNPVTDLAANDDSASGNEDTTISSSVAGNDSTTSGGALTYAVDTGVSNGSLVFSSDGSYDYTPNANFNGSDSFTYTVTDAASGETSTQTVSLTVNPVADLTANDDTASGNEDTTISSTVASNDSTTSGGTLTYAVDTGVSNGSLVFSSDGSYDYTPNANFNGTDSFTYTVTDAASGETATQTVTLTVNPVTDLAANDDTASGNEDTTISSSVAGNDSTTSGGALTYAVATGVTNGSLVFSSDGSYDYTPNSNFTGTDSFTYIVTDADSGETSTQNVTITVNPVTDLTAADDTASGNEDTIISSTVASNDSTTSGGTLTYAIDTGVTNGSLVFSSDGSYDYTPNSNFNGTDSFTYTVTDIASGESLTQTVSLTVNPVSDLTAADDTASGNEDTVISSTVASNDSTTSGGALTYAVDTGVSNGSLVFSSDGSYDYTPNANFNGTDSFTYTVTDAASGETATQTVTLTVNPVTDLAANDDTASGNEDTTISSTVASNDSTTSGGALTYAIDTGVTNGSLVFSSDGSYDYTPNTNFNGTDSFTYTVADVASGETATQTVSLTVNPVADLTATDDTASGNEDTTISSSVAGNDSTTSGGALTYAVDTGVTNGSLAFSSDGSYDYTPNANFNGTDSFTYTVTDAASGETATQTVTLTVNPVTDLAAIDDTASGNEDTTISSSVAGNDSTTSGGALTYAVDTGVSNGSLVFSSDGSYDYTPNANFNGTDSFTYTVTDAASGETATQTVSLTVNSVTDLTAADDTASGNEDTTISNTVASNDSTTSGGALTYAIDTGVSNGSLAFNSDGSYDYTPNANFNGTDSFTYTVTDTASGESLTQTVNITVNPVNDAPVANDDYYVTADDTSLTAGALSGLLINDTDAEGDTLQISQVTVGGVDYTVPASGATTITTDNGVLQIAADGSFDYTPDSGYIGVESFDYALTDGNGGTSTANFSIEVDATAESPYDVEASLGNSGYAYSVATDKDTGDTYLWRLDMLTGDILKVGTVISSDGKGYDIEGLIYDPNTGYLYGAGTGVRPGFIKMTTNLDDIAANGGSAIVQEYGSIAGNNNDVADVDSGAMALTIDGNGTMYLTTVQGNESMLYTVNETTGELTLVGGMGDVVESFDYHPDTGEFYGLVTDANKTYLNEFTITGGTITSVQLHEIGQNLDIQGMAAGPNYNMWAIDRGTGDVLEIDINTGTVSLIVSTPVNELQGDGFESLAIGPRGNGLLAGMDFTYNLSGNFGTDNQPYETHYFLVGLSADSVANGLSVIDGQTGVSIIELEAGNIYGVAEGSYVRIEADTVLDPVTGISRVSVEMTAPLTPDDFNLPVYAVEEDTRADLNPDTNYAVTLASTDQVFPVDYDTAVSGTYVGDDTGNVIQGSAAIDDISGAGGDDYIYADTGNDNVSGGLGNDRLHGGDGNDTISGEQGNDMLFGGLNDDSLLGGSGIDILNGGAGSDTLTGGTDSDTFTWSAGNEGTEGAPAIDTILDFNPGAGGDVLNLADMLQGENTGNLTDYLSFQQDGSGGTIVNVDTDGGGSFAQTQQINLTGVDLTAGGTLTDQNILDNLLADGNLIVD